METLVHKASGTERNLAGNAISHVQYASIANTTVSTAQPQATTSVQVTPATQVIVPQPAPISKAAKPVRDSAQFVCVT